jgi:hypothetical protein
MKTVPKQSILDWRQYSLDKRHAPWKLLLPIDSEGQILAIGLNGIALASLARSWAKVDAYLCSTTDIEWATEQGQSLEHDYQFERVKDIDAQKRHYAAIAINANLSNHSDCEKILNLLKPGGSAVWIGSSSEVPSPSILFKCGYADVRRYALLPPSSGKILLPIGSHELTKAGLKLYSPAKTFNRMLVQVAGFAATMRLQYLIGARQVVVARKPGALSKGEYFIDWVSQYMNIRVRDICIYSGWERLVVQLIDEQHKVLAIAKLAETIFGQRANQREMNVLRSIEHNFDLQGSVPKIIGTHVWQSHDIQLQNVAEIGVRRFTTKLMLAHMHFLISLGRMGRCEMTLNDWPRWKEICEWAHESSFKPTSEAIRLRDAVADCSERLQNIKIPFHRIHGDFTPWNVLVGSHDICVVDWEESETLGLPYTDLVHYAVACETVKKERKITIEKLLSNNLSSLKIDTQMQILQKALAIPKYIERVSIIHELWFRQCRWGHRNL